MKDAQKWEREEKTKKLVLLSKEESRTEDICDSVQE